MRRIKYKNLNARQKESYNFQKASAVLADYGYATIRLSDDWRGADFIAQHTDGVTFHRVQLKGRLTFNKKYLRRHLYICFRSADRWYFYPHDKLLQKVRRRFSHTKSWKKRGGYSYGGLSVSLQELLRPYILLS
jgi:hypothetical protein